MTWTGLDLGKAHTQVCELSDDGQIFARDGVREANYQLYVLRRAGDLAPFERARRQHLLGTTR